METSYNDVIERDESKRVLFDAVIKDLPKDMILNQKEGSFLKSFPLSRGKVPIAGDTYVINLHWYKIAELCEAGKVEIEGRDTQKDAAEAWRKDNMAKVALHRDSLLKAAELIKRHVERRPKRVVLQGYCGGKCTSCRCVSCTNGGEGNYAETPWPPDECACCQPQHVPDHRERHSCANFYGLEPGFSRKSRIDSTGEFETVHFGKNKEWANRSPGFI
jgi:hypothetical protein